MRASADILTDLNAAYESRRVALTAQSYSMDDGQGKQTVTRASISDINKTIRLLESEYESAVSDESGVGGLVAGDFRRF